ncbi:MAG: hypothetical protein IPH08_00350 [Rhodocyclaceae bacterium]|nr:hypothetical protein [Rhodocyclaceae bacterium]
MTLTEFLQSLQSQPVEFVLVGGLAVQLHGYVRATFDVDLVLAMNPENLARFVQCCKRQELSPTIPVPLEAIADADLVERWHREKGMLAFSVRESRPAGLVVDVLVRPEISFDELIRDAVPARLAGQVLRIASIAHLIAMKRAAGRPRDLLDIAALEKIARGESPDDRSI